ncbi:Uncharacterised protein [Escherichia coli]|nr:Uncharacterised protein [Escherichia coli]
MQMELISRKEFDSRVTSGELDNLQAIKVKEGFCLIGKSERNKSRFYASPYGSEAICLEERNWSQLIRSNEGVP